MTSLAYPGDEQTSANDVQALRGHDQRIAVITSALDQMGDACWKSGRVEPEARWLLQCGLTTRPTPWTGVACMLSRARTPLAAVGEARHNAIAGSHHYVNAGSRSVYAGSSEDAKVLAAKLNREQRTLVAPWIQNYLKALNAFALGGRGLTGVDEWEWCVVATPQINVWVGSEEEADKLRRVLNESYLQAIAPAREWLLSELAQLTRG